MKSIKYIAVICMLLLVQQSAIAQPSGNWEGQISVMGQKVGIEFNFDKGDNGMMNVPAQGAYNLEINRLTFEDGDILMLVDSAQSDMEFKGKMISKDSIGGTFMQRGFTGEFGLNLVTQEEEDHSWIDREVRFANDTVELAGTLSLPDTTSKHPAVFFISGSGQQDRDENVFGFKVFKTMAPAFINKGFAVLRYDDRGTGESDHGNPNACDTRDFARDATAAFDFLKNHPNVDAAQIGILGHSEGGIIAPMVASDRDPAFVVLMAGPTITGHEVLREQSRSVMESMGTDSAEIARTIRLNTMVYKEAMKENPDKETIYWMLYDFLQEEGDMDSLTLEKTVEEQSKVIMMPWFRFFLKYDPLPALKDLEIPALLLFGGKDVQVLADQNIKALETLSEKERKNITVKVFPEANHLFQKAKTGGVQEYSELPGEFTTGYLDYITTWSLKAIE